MSRSRIILTAAGILIIIGLITGVILKLTASDDDLSGAVEDFNDQEYTSAIEKLNALIPAGDYEGSEKIYYYRARALNGLAGALEEDYEDELKLIQPGQEGTPEYQKAFAKVNKKLEKLNSETGGDLKIIPERPSAFIASEGKFMDEFVSKYRGSSLIEDLDYEQLQQIFRTQEGGKPLRSLIRFYEKYPNTSYVAGLVKMIFSSIQNSEVSAEGISDTVMNILISYGRRYPTSPEMNLIYTCTGDDVNMRNSPGVNGGLVGTLSRNSVLLQLEKSMDTAQIGDTRDYWYRVSNLNGQKGWIFGKFIAPFDIRNYAAESAEEKWAIDEHFQEWADSNSPERWRHVDDSGRTGISFINSGENRLALLKSDAGMKTGLFARYNSTRAFAVLAEARYAGRDGFTLFAYCQGDKAFYLNIQNEQIDVCGRIIPLHTGDWHDYRLESEDGQYAALTVDGQLLSGRIPGAAGTDFTDRGIYLMYSGNRLSSSGEVRYIKVR